MRPDNPVPDPEAPGAIRVLRGHVALGASAALWWGLAFLGQRPWFQGIALVTTLSLAWGLWWIVVRTAGGLGPASRFGWWTVIHLAGLVSAPVLEDDGYRYLWDGRQTVTTGNPYRTAPADHFGDIGIPEDFQRILDAVNYPDVPTIYGPVLQAAFAGSYLVSPGSLWPLKLLWIVVQGMTWYGWSRATSDRRVWWFGLCPLAVFETAFNAHPDALGVALLVAAMLAARKGWAIRVGVFLGLAAAAKVFALLFVPFLLRTASGRARVAFAGTWLVAYMPFWFQGSLADWHGLVAFAAHWEFNSSLFGLLRGLGGDLAARTLIPVGFLAFYVFEYLRWPGPSGAAWPPGGRILGAFFLGSATVNPWYLLWLSPFVALRPTRWGCSALAAVSLSYLYAANLGDPGGGFQHPMWVRPLEYGVILIAALRDARDRRILSRLAQAPTPASQATEP